MEQTSMDFIRARLPQDKQQLERIAEGANVPFHTLRKIAYGETNNPRISTVESLLRYFRQQGIAI